MRKLKLYLDTSVWNFYYADDAPDEKERTRLFFDGLSRSDTIIYIADPVFQEIEQAYENKRQMLYELINRHNPLELEYRTEVDELALEYIKNGVLLEKSQTDALHIAYASVHEMDCIVSWNMKHIANIQKQEKVHAVNLMNSYIKHIQLITLYSLEQYENENH